MGKGRIARIVALLTVLGGISLLSAGCEQNKREEAPKPSPVIPVTIGEATARRVERTLNQVGTLQANQEVIVRTEIEGQVVEILFKEGKEVRKGDVLVRLDSAKTVAEIQSLEARIEQFKVRLENKVRNLERNRSLAERDMVSRQQFDNLQAEVKETGAEIAQARANLGLQRVRLADKTIRGPFDGVAGVRKISVGDYLKVGDPVVTIVSLNPLEMSFQAPEKLKPRIFLGQECQLTVDPYPGRTFIGVISFIAPQVDVQTRTFQVKAQVNNNEPLLNPGMFARVEVVTEVNETGLTVPWESVIQTEDETYVYAVVDGGIARKVPVRLGRITSEWAEVSAEAVLSPGCSVILEGKFAARDGMKITIQQTQKSD